MATLPKRGEMTRVNPSRGETIFLLPRFPVTFKEYFKMTVEEDHFVVDKQDLMTVLDSRKHTREEKSADNMQHHKGFNTWLHVLLTDGRIGWVMAKYLEVVTK